MAIGGGSVLGCAVMSTWLPSIARHPCSSTNPADCYFPVVQIRPPSPGAYSAEGLAHHELERAFDTLEKKLLQLFKEGDAIEVGGVPHRSVASAMAALRAKYGTVGGGTWPA